MDPAHEPPPRPPAIRIDITPRSIGLVLLAIAAVWFAFSLANVLLVVLVALILVGTIEPIINWLERHRLGRGNALALVFIAFAIVFAGLLLLTVPPLVAQLAELTTRAPAALDSLIAWLGTYEGTDSMIRSLTSLPIDDLTARAGRSLLGYSTAVLTAIGYALTTMFLAIYLLADPLGSKGIVFAVVTRRHHVKLARILYELKVIVGGYMRGQLITSAAITVFVFIVLSVLRVENALAIAIFAGLTDVIPFVGGLIASAPVIAAVAPRGIVTVLVVAAVMFVYQEFETRILVPRVYGRVLRLSPAIVLVALLVGGTLMGILGALLALPIAAGVRMLVRELRVELPGAAPADES
ncbi:MAG: AI-2E family transporter, partial [Deltaproteobacteria bacterium]|nr:AI-2E family transporter [Deltaproteobacteria bacterium]